MGMAAFLLSSFPPHHRHSRVSGNPERYCLMMVLSTGNRGIPAYAGMTVGAAGRPVLGSDFRDSRLRGKDGRGGEIPLTRE